MNGWSSKLAIGLIVALLSALLTMSLRLESQIAELRKDMNMLRSEIMCELNKKLDWRTFDLWRQKNVREYSR